MNIVLIGGGDHAQYTIDILEKMGMYHIVGIVDSRRDIDEIVYGYPVIGRQEDMPILVHQYSITGYIVSIGDNWSRYKVSQQLAELIPDIPQINAIHPSVIIGRSVTIGRGIIAMARVIWNPGSYIGNGTFYATGAQVEHDCTIDDYSSVSAGSVMGGHVTLGRYSAIALGCTIFDRVTIGENTVIGSGSLVTHDVPADVLAYGSPAAVVRTRYQGEKFLK